MAVGTLEGGRPPRDVCRCSEAGFHDRLTSGPHGYCARLPALIATLSSPDREIVLLRVVAGESIPDIVAALGVMPAAICPAQHQALISTATSGERPWPATNRPAAGGAVAPDPNRAR